MTHVTDVKPLVSVVAYTDPETGYEVYQEVTGRTFKPLDNDSKEVGNWVARGVGGGSAVRLGLCGSGRGAVGQPQSQLGNVRAARHGVLVDCDAAHTVRTTYR